jgi:hypothetical protein
MVLVMESAGTTLWKRVWIPLLIVVLILVGSAAVFLGYRLYVNHTQYALLSLMNPHFAPEAMQGDCASAEG